MMAARIPCEQIPKFAEKGICLDGGTMLADNTYVFILRDADQAVFLEMVREEIRLHPEQASSYLKAWVEAQESEGIWRTALSAFSDPFTTKVEVQGEE